MDKNVRRIRIDNEDDLFKVLTGLGILGHEYAKPQVENKDKNEKVSQPHECACKKIAKDENAVRRSVIDNRRIILPIVDATGRQRGITSPDINYYTIEDFLNAVVEGEANNVIIGAGDSDHFVSIPFDAIDDFIEWLTDVRTLVKTKTHYFDEPIKMTRVEIEKALGHKFIICD